MARTHANARHEQTISDGAEAHTLLSAAHTIGVTLGLEAETRHNEAYSGALHRRQAEEREIEAREARKRAMAWAYQLAKMGDY